MEGERRRFRRPADNRGRNTMDATPSRLELSPLNFLRRNAQALGQRPAVVHGERRMNYAELEERCNRLASALRDRGLERHDRVAILAPNTPALLEAHYGIPLAGGVLVAMNTRLSPGGRAHPEGLRRAAAAGRRPAQGARRRRRHRRHRDDRDRGHGRGRRSLRAVAGRRVARGARELARGRERADLDQLHLGHHRASPRARSTPIEAPISRPTAWPWRSGWATTRCTCGRSRCSTATAGA